MDKWKFKLGDVNKSFIFILPLLGVDDDGKEIYLNGSQIKFDFFKNNKVNFVNCFIGDDSKGIVDTICLLYNFSGSLDYTNLEKKLVDHPLYIDSYSPDHKTDMFLFKIPKFYEEDYRLIKEGKYSLTSKLYQNQCIKFLKHEVITQGLLNVQQIFSKSEDAYRYTEKKYGIEIPRNQEPFGIFDHDMEYYQEEYIIPDNNALKQLNDGK